MSTTPAAELARLKVAYKQWWLTRTTDGFAGPARGQGWCGQPII